MDWDGQHLQGSRGCALTLYSEAPACRNSNTGNRLSGIAVGTAGSVCLQEKAYRGMWVRLGRESEDETVLLKRGQWKVGSR